MDLPSDTSSPTGFVPSTAAISDSYRQGIEAGSAAAFCPGRLAGPPGGPRFCHNATVGPPPRESAAPG